MLCVIRAACTHLKPALSAGQHCSSRSGAAASKTAFRAQAARIRIGNFALLALTVQFLRCYQPCALAVRSNISCQTHCLRRRHSPAALPCPRYQVPSANSTWSQGTRWSMAECAARCRASMQARNSSAEAALPRGAQAMNDAADVAQCCGSASVARCCAA
jgi:hypothetical protein